MHPAGDGQARDVARSPGLRGREPGDQRDPVRPGQVHQTAVAEEPDRGDEPRSGRRRGGVRRSRSGRDDVIPDLASAGVLLDTADQVPPDRAAELVGRARDLIATDVGRLRSLLTDLLPPELTPATLPAVFAQLVEQVRDDDLQVSLTVEDIPIDAGVTVLLYRVAGELLRTAVAHAGADHLDAHIGPGPGGHEPSVCLRVVDDGRGFDPADPPRPGHIGLLLVRRTVEDAGGWVAVDSSPGPGTTIAVVVPFGVAGPLSRARSAGRPAPGCARPGCGSPAVPGRSRRPRRRSGRCRCGR